MLFKTGVQRLVTVTLWSALLLSISGTVLGSDRVTEGSKAKSLKSCVVTDTEDMRRNHMDYMKHDRDLTVRKGDRSVTNSLAGCVNCHGAKDSSGKAVPVNGHDADGKPQFCAGCHEYTGVSITCFQCHRKVPEE